MKRWLVMVVWFCVMEKGFGQSGHRFCYDFEPQTPMPEWAGSWKLEQKPVVTSQAYLSQGCLSYSDSSNEELPPLIKVPLPDFPSRGLEAFEIEFLLKPSVSNSNFQLWYSIADAENGPATWLFPYPEGHIRLEGEKIKEKSFPNQLALNANCWYRVRVEADPIIVGETWSGCRSCAIHIAVKPELPGSGKLWLDNLCIQYREPDLQLEGCGRNQCKPLLHSYCRGPDE